MNSLSAVIVAAGSSHRFNKNLSSSSTKQFVSWDKKPLFIHTLEALSVLPIEEYVLVIRLEDETIFHEELKKFNSIKNIRIVFGGKRRQDSVRNGLKALSACERVLIHDSARPFLSASMLLGLNEASKNSEAIIPTVPVYDTLKEVDENGLVIKTHDRTKFLRVQTPQFFCYEKILEVHERLSTEETEFTDDAAMFEHSGFQVKVAHGAEENIKITVKEDLNGRI